ncbi:MAG: hypothetical protein ABW318_27500 [Vicinamibacterales bacterium]
MANTAQNLTTGLAFTVTLFTTIQAVAAEDRPVTLVLHVEDYARVPAADRSAAQAEVTRIYAAAGVRTVWATGNDYSDAPGLHLRVILFSRDVAMPALRAEAVPGSVLGLAVREAGRAYILTHRIANLAQRHGDEFRWLLGRVLAHEVGHLVLPDHSHSDQGIMRANVGVRSKSDREFTTEQAAVIRSILLAAPRP